VRDITERKRIEKALQDLSGENAMLLRELQHRIANSLQIVASILSLRA
jgi:two-component sensor histidine kinase